MGIDSPEFPSCICVGAKGVVMDVPGTEVGGTICVQSAHRLHLCEVAHTCSELVT